MRFRYPALKKSSAHMCFVVILCGEILMTRGWIQIWNAHENGAIQQEVLSLLIIFRIS